MCYQWFLITKCGCYNTKFRINFAFSRGNDTGAAYDMVSNIPCMTINQCSPPSHFITDYLHNAIPYNAEKCSSRKNQQAYRILK